MILNPSAKLPRAKVDPASCMQHEFDVNFQHILKVVAQMQARPKQGQRPLTNIKRKGLQFDLIGCYALARDLMHKFLQTEFRSLLQDTFKANSFERLVKILAIAEEQDVSLAGGNKVRKKFDRY